jgi:hypothetical protein
MQDKGKKVRARAVRILVDIASSQPTSPHIPEISQLLIARVSDQDESVKVCLLVPFVALVGPTHQMSETGVRFVGGHVVLKVRMRLPAAIVV